MVANQDCVVCQTIAEVVSVPGGILIDDGAWAFYLRNEPELTAGEGFIGLKRHCEQMAQLTDEEVRLLGEMMRRVDRAYREALSAEQVHFGIYGEGVRHLHVHVFPRGAGLPASHFLVTFKRLWVRVLIQLGLKRPIPKGEAIEAAERLKACL
ncbi:MAG: HIT domain-containing protein [Anaerolineaceae bacterium]|nr:HIT domain-containing protein [Anaerolineaceae bacterium]